MQIFTPLVQQLIDSLCTLPGIGSKSAQRIAFQLLQRKRQAGLFLASALEQSLQRVGHCQKCYTFSEDSLCNFCMDPARDGKQLCVVETPADIFALEQTRTYSGLYFILMGHLSPLDGIGPEDLRLPLLKSRVADEHICEVILATNATVEGEATAHYIYNLLKDTKACCTRIAHGVPMDGELSYLDVGTLSKALSERTRIAKGET